jgi:hypothetical protein
MSEVSHVIDPISKLMIDQRNNVFANDTAYENAYLDRLLAAHDAELDVALIQPTKYAQTVEIQSEAAYTAAKSYEGGVGINYTPITLELSGEKRTEAALRAKVSMVLQSPEPPRFQLLKETSPDDLRKYRELINKYPEPSV